MNQTVSNVLLNLALGHPAAFDAYMEWAEGQENPLMVLEAYDFLVFIDEDAAIRIIGMPFLEHMTESEYKVLRALRDIAATDREAFDHLLAHPLFEREIVDEDTASLIELMATVSLTP